MATGYTHEIINGNITTFKDFAILCTRAFGATIHMRDENLDTPYEPRTVSSYYSESIAEKAKELEHLNSISIEDFEKEMIAQWERDIQYHQNAIEKSKKDYEVLIKLLEEAKAFVPPTDEHVNFKEFIIEQLKGTIEYDCNITYHLNSLEELNDRINNYDIEKEKADKITAMEDSLEYSKKSLNDEIRRVNDSNKWMSDLFKVLT